MSSQIGQNNIQGNKKRYLIMTYCAEFDKVHYPMPLNYDENPDPEQLKSTVRRLRIELEELRNNMSGPVDGSTQNLIQYKQENDILKQKLRKQEEMIQQLNQMNNNQIQTQNNEQELSELRDIISQKEREITEQKNINLQLKNELVNNNAKDRELMLESQLRETKNKFDEMEKIIQELVKEIENQKSINHKQFLKIQSLEEELEASLIAKKNKQLTNLKKTPSYARLNELSASKRSTSQPIKQSPMKYTNNKATPRKNSTKKLNLNINTSMTKNSNAKKKENSNNNHSFSNSSIYSKQSVAQKGTPKKSSTNIYNNRNSVMYQQTQSSINKRKEGAIHNRSPSPMRRSLLSSFQRKPQNSTKNDQIKNNNQDSDDDEENRLLRKLQSLREKNKENSQQNSNINNNSSLNMSNLNQSQNQQQQQQQFKNNNQLNKNKIQNDSSVSDIDARLNNLTELLRMAKQ
ncbi:hypothetical protein PPERSA_08585 [Pseudocohnilembus persalinus]|uniref:Uncharacterized protein n=1 Tax=Pseudocohnilembus persalinus TaxID=266149 RepID=A0A0V0R6P5_PSEPJ|nr:hypothetical protein PPERSA_08585 [Pseudocohnilembus persalinus]|eukprot:KRX10182.1 hypothetical protein PPERSA_08585 [Pseudocohnilembus persalinus]